MKVMVFGANGFMGSSVCRLLAVSHTVVPVSRNKKSTKITADLTNKENIVEAITSTQPDIIVSCAGVLDNNETAQQNVTFTTNILEAIAISKVKIKRFILCGSASIYGQVTESDLPVGEDQKTAATAAYGVSKLQEEKQAMILGKKYGVQVISVRIFNAIGIGMNPRLLIPIIISQTQNSTASSPGLITVSRLDSKRDYVAVDDVASAIGCLVDNQPKHNVYNVGSGHATTNKELIELVLKENKTQPKIIESLDSPEPLYACQADISRLNNEFGWQPKVSLDQSIKEIIHAVRQ